MISLIFIALGAMCDSIRDTLLFHWHIIRPCIKKRLNENWWNPTLSWRRKYIDGDPDKGLKYKFPFSFMIIFTDAPHFFKALMLIFIFLACLSLIIGYDYLMVEAFYETGFETLSKFMRMPWFIKCHVPLEAPWWNWNTLIYTVLWYVAWNGVFLTFYKYVWIKK